MDPPNPASVRVLTRPPIPALTNSLDPPPQPSPASTSTSTSTSTSNSLPHSPNGVVVVGFISQRPDISSQLINRVLDCNAFGSGRLDKRLDVDKEEVNRWFESRRISYYHEEEKGLLFLQFCSTRCPVLCGSSECGSDFDSVVEEHEFGDLQGLLFMFSVCHVIIYIQEGSRFETQILKKFRVLQAAKHALTPYVRTRSTPPLPTRPHSSSPARPSITVTSSNTSSPGTGRSGGISGRNASAISLMSGLGSYTSLFPGQCTPVTLFAFIEDLTDMPNPSSDVEESTDASSLGQPSNFSRPTLPVKGSGSVVVLARPTSKSEGSFRKKLLSSLEAQIRFLIKKCRTLSGSESGNGPRGGSVLSSPLFSLDASRTAVLLDRSTCQSGESLEFTISLVDDVLNGEATSDTLLLESHSQSANKEDILLVKEFIFRQSDILRGRGGLVTSTNNSSAAGVGMVAVAAAAAAASAASGKTLTTPELPSLDIWLTSSKLILQGILSAKRGCIDETEIHKRKHRQKNTLPPQDEGIAPKAADPLDIAVSLLESGGGLNKKFSTLWCERSLPAAKDVYLKDLPVCYPTSQHEAHLEKALHAFRSMVRGPAVPLYAKMLEDKCKCIWESGRQLCDAVSLTGKPCMHQRHNVENDESVLGTAIKPHSSGYFFLRACACGRSRHLWSDPFDFESANNTSSCFSDCDKLLPKVELPEMSIAGPVNSSSWNLLRVGGARYYEPSKGLLQSGFYATHKFLLKWTIFLETQKTPKDLPGKAALQGPVIQSSTEPNIELHADIDIKTSGDRQMMNTGHINGAENQRKPTENRIFQNNKISFGRGLPNFTMRKPFSEVVAGSAVTDSKFPPLQQRKQHSAGSEKGVKENMPSDQSVEGVHASVDQGSQKSQDSSSVQETVNEINSSGSGGDPFLRIGSNVVPVNFSGGEKVKLNPTLKHVTIYVGFEHECPHGHRFLLNPEHLNELGSSYSLLEESHPRSFVETLDHNPANSSNLIKKGSHGRVHRMANGLTAGAAINKVRGAGNSKEIIPNGNLHEGGLEHISRHGKEQNQAVGMVTLPNNVKDLEAGLQPISLGDDVYAFSMLNRNLPIYMNCPHCRATKNKKDPPKIKFAGTISQLQRMFLVTPPFPIVLATCPAIQFEVSCLPPSILDREQRLQFNLGSRVILPPESFLALRLPFVYGVQLEDGSLQCLKPFEHDPEKTAWIVRGTALQVISKGSSSQTY